MQKSQILKILRVSPIRHHTHDFLWNIAFISYWNDFSVIPLGKCASLRRATKICKKFKFWKFWESPLSNIGEYAFNYSCLYFRAWKLKLITCCSEYCVFKWGLKFSFFPSISNFFVEFGQIRMCGWFYDIQSFYCSSVASEAPRIRAVDLPVNFEIPYIIQ